MVATLVRLRWRLLVNMMTRNVWNLIGSLLGGLNALVLLAALAAGAVALGARAPQGVAPVVVAGGSLTVLGWTLLPLLLTGTDGTLDPRAVAAWTAPSRTLARGLAVAGAAGLPGIATGVAFLLPPLAWCLAGRPGTALLALLLAPAALATCVLLSRVVVISAGVSSSRRGRDLVAVIAGLLVPLLFLLPSIINSVAASASASGVTAVVPLLRRGAEVLGMTPLGWAFSAPAYLAQGSLWLAVLTALGALAVPVLLLPLWEQVVRRVMTGPAHSRGRTRSYAETGAGKQSDTLVWHRRLERVVPSPAAAVAARCLRYWRTDPRYLVQGISIVLLPVVMAGVSLVNTASRVWEVTVNGEAVGFSWGHAPVRLLALPVGVALLSGWASHNDLAMDSTALWSHLSAGLSGRHDRVGRLVAAALWQVPLLAAQAVLCAGLTGRWDLLPAVLGVSAGVYGAALAWSAVMGVLAPYEANAPGESPMSSRTSGAAFVAFLLHAAGVAVVIGLALPVLAAFIVLMVTGAWSWGWLLLAAGLAWGLALVAGGVALGGRELDSRGPRVLATIRSWPGHEAIG